MFKNFILALKYISFKVEPEYKTLTYLVNTKYDLILHRYLQKHENHRLKNVT